MPDATITSTASTFGTISGTFAADQSTVTGTITGIITGTLSGSVGVPGQQGPTGPQGPQGEPGEGVPVGGTAGQFLTKIDGTNYNTDWTTLNLSAYLTDAPSDGSQYARQSGAWEVVSIPPDYITSVAAGTPLSVNSGELNIDLSAYAQQTWVLDQGFAPLASPAFYGNPTAPTPAFGDNDTSISTTAFVQSALAGGTAVAKNLEVYVRNQTGSTVPAGSIVYISGATGNRPLITLAQANNDANSAQTMGFTKTAIANNGFGYVIVRGELENIDTSALTEGVQLYLSPTTAGTWTTTKPSAPQHLVYVGIVVRAHPTLGVILVAVQNGYELNELHDVKITSVSNGQVLKYDSAQNLWVNATDSSGVAWGGITGTLSSQTDLQSALEGKYSTTNPAGYITSSALTPYLTSATAASTYQTIAGMSSYLTTSAAASTYYPLSGNPSGFLTSSSLTGYATESWVTSQGYLTASSLTPYLTKADNLGSLTNFATARSNLGLGSLDTPTFAGVNVPGSGTSVANLGATFLTLNQQGHGQFTIQPSQGIVFPDASIQTTAVNGTVLGDYLTKAGNLSGLASTSTARTNLGLGTLATVNDAPSDGSQYARKNGAWDVVTGGGSSYITSVSSPLAVSSGNLTVDLSAYAPLASPALTGTPTAPTASLGTNTTQIATTAFVIANAGGGGGGGGVDIQTFGSPTSSGTFTWTKPAGAKWVYFYLQGAGGGGASGSRQATTVARSGGGGAAGGAYHYNHINADALGATENVVIGAGGSGGPSRITDNSAHAAGGNGGDTTFAGYCARGTLGATSNTAGATRVSIIFNTSTFANTAGAGQTAGGSSGGSFTGSTFPGLGGGGGAGAAANITTPTQGGFGGGYSQASNTSGILTSIAGGVGGVGATLVPATNGTSDATGKGSVSGTGGGGGFYRTATAGNNGGNGGWPGGGGGGGGASDNGFASGAGGNGGNGFALIITYF
jgi:hypothetical protein